LRAKAIEEQRKTTMIGVCGVRSLGVELFAVMSSTVASLGAGSVLERDD
jgi:hypothetical protein